MHKDEVLHLMYRGVEVPETFASVEPAQELEAFMAGVDAVIDALPTKIMLGDAPLTPTGEKLTDLKYRNTQQGSGLVRNGNQPSEGVI